MQIKKRVQRSPNIEATKLTLEIVLQKSHIAFKSNFTIFHILDVMASTEVDKNNELVKRRQRYAEWLRTGRNQSMIEYQCNTKDETEFVEIYFYDKF